VLLYYNFTILHCPYILTVWFWGLGSHMVTGNVAIQKSAYNFLFDFNINYASILYHFRVTASCEKSPIISYPLLHLAPQLVSTPFEFRRNFWRQKTRSPGLSCGVVCLRDPTFSCFDTILARDTHNTRQQHIPY